MPRWHSTSAPSAPVVPPTAFAVTRRPPRQPAPGQLVVRADLHAAAGPAADDRQIERYEVALGYHQVRTLGELDLVAIRIDPARLLRLRLADVAADGRVLWQENLPIHLPATQAVQ